MPRNNRVETTQPYGAEKTEPKASWAHPMHDVCQECGTCFTAFCCTPCYSCYVFGKAREWFCTPMICPCALAPLRAKIRNNYGIDGMIMKDHCAVCFCYSCTLLQIANEMHYQGIQMY